MRLVSRVASFSLALATVAAGSAACTAHQVSGSSGPAGASGGSATTSGKTALTVVQTGDFTTFDPTQLPLNDWAEYFQLYDTLTLENAQLQPQPRLATSWQFSSDKLSLTLNLRPGVEYSDGTAFKAQDVIWNINRYKDKATGANIRALVATITSVEAPDDKTVVLHFSKPTPNIFDALDLLFIVKPQSSTADIKTKPIGTGPFKLGQWQPGSQTTFLRNDHYWQKGLPKLQQIVFKDAPDPQSALVMFRAKQADVLVQPSYTDFASLKSQASVKTLVAGVGATVNDILVNVAKPPLNDPRVRQAISYALDRGAFIKSYLAGQSTPWCLPWGDGTPAYDATPDAARNCPQDIAKAKQLLAAAGYPHGFTTTILTSSEGYLPGSNALAQILQQDLAQIGVKLTINNMDAAAARVALLGKKYDLAAHVYGRSNRSPATLFEASLPWAAHGNIVGFSSPDYTALVTSAETADPAQAKSVYTKLNQYILDQSFIITVAPQVRMFAMQPAVTGLVGSVDGMPLFENVTG